jgi:hypothetical protein
MIPVTAHLDLVTELAKGTTAGAQRRLLRNHSQVALLAGRLSFFDLHDEMAARGYLSMALDSAREADDPYLSVATLGHMSFVPADASGFTAAVNLRATAMEERRPVAAADAKLAVQGDRGGAAERQGPLPAALAEHQHDVQVEGKIGHPEAGLPAASGTDVEHGHDRDGLVGHDGWLQARHRVDGDLFLVLQPAVQRLELLVAGGGSRRQPTAEQVGDECLEVGAGGLGQLPPVGLEESRELAGCGGRDRARTCDLVVVSDRTAVCRAAKTAGYLLDRCP